MVTKAIHWLQYQWRHTTLWHLLLIPFSWLFAAASALRHFLYRLNILRSQRLTVPVVVIGNISVGGTGKTPLVIWLAQQFIERGWHPGIISRGYGGTAATALRVTADSNVDIVGDEPLLLAQTLQCPVWIGRNRPVAGRALVAAHPDTDVIISDDGLQHLALARNVEIAVIDASRGLGNGRLLPAGPLRESVSRLTHVDAVIINQTGTSRAELPEVPHSYAMQFTGSTFRNLKRPEQIASTADFHGKTLHAIAGIGHPQRFFDQLKTLGLNFVAHAFPDHHKYLAHELNFAGLIIMTEKDAVKCQSFATEQMWVWPILAQLSPELMPFILAKLGTHHG
ncbi:MAG: tetraacyldisaccharide 4'-kinase [Sulfuriferula sp.]